MAKASGKQPSKNTQNKHLMSRVSYLHQATVYLSERIEATVRPEKGENLQVPGAHDSEAPETTQTSEDKINLSTSGFTSVGSASTLIAASGTQCHLLNHLHLTARKAQVRVSQDIKRSVCKRCNALLVAGSTSYSKLENKSKHGKKPWADIHVVECLKCGANKRFPVGAMKQERKGKRRPKSGKAFEAIAVPKDGSTVNG